jgi:hypothetical protein
MKRSFSECLISSYISGTLVLEQSLTFYEFVMNKRMILAWAFSILATLFLAVPVSFHTGVLAEQSGDTPESGMTSYIKQIYDSLVTLTYGSDAGGGWGNWGAMWNRIRSAAEWAPDGTATAGDVVYGKTFYGLTRDPLTGTLALTGDATAADVTLGKTFYSDSLTRLTGTAPAPIDWTNLQFSARDDYAGTYNYGIGPEDYQGEEAEWTDHSVDTDVVWKDERAGLYWSADRGVITSNNFTAMSLETCDFFDTGLYATRAAYPGGDTDCGDAINYCATLDYGDRTDWYLPSQKELMLAYIDGMYNQAGSTAEEAAAFTWGTTDGGGYPYWSSSEVSDLDIYAWYVNLYYGITLNFSKTSGYAVRCVARD